MITYNIFTIDDTDVIGHNKFHNFQDAAIILNKKGYGRNNFLKALREEGVLDRFNRPIDNWEQSVFFQIYTDYHRTLLISTYGINYFKRVLFQDKSN